MWGVCARQHECLKMLTCCYGVEYTAVSVCFGNTQFVHCIERDCMATKQKKSCEQLKQLMSSLEILDSGSFRICDAVFVKEIEKALCFALNRCPKHFNIFVASI